ncbi:uncharacterized protein AMSG_10410 [Thecamonas trahens ATCC 50062]|uniref:Uncharacterized protein n=1 Tax=Thecamonas trahens ATCC 50062 TaxID=461836 RepID=A0A0L0DQM9_THETB|nr:hypothetical protein AMSG_10410 [Thecamonas trahens ATCC 50062]KNC54560.1 hypothetical protein AMSG_10410 [Thecamonas trahens ATCC 50062]|eukprot:XP_013753575.1 hypothetical protein AMSG_10410 [Thecamonas trahens ATCC 50062]
MYNGDADDDEYTSRTEKRKRMLLDAPSMSVEEMVLLRMVKETEDELLNAQEQSRNLLVATYSQILGQQKKLAALAAHTLVSPEGTTAVTTTT